MLFIIVDLTFTGKFSQRDLYMAVPDDLDTDICKEYPLTYNPFNLFQGEKLKKKIDNKSQHILRSENKSNLCHTRSSEGIIHKEKFWQDIDKKRA